MEEEEDASFTIYDTVNATVYELLGTTPVERPIRCLKPCAHTIEETATFPPICGPAEPYLGRKKRTSLVIDFQGWTLSTRNWRCWLWNQRCKHEATIWTQAHIRDAVLSSIYHIPIQQATVLHLGKFWCPTSNTFVLKWGEATITLEDVWVLGGYSVLGDPVSLPLQDESEKELRDKLLEFQIDMYEIDTGTTEQVKWMDFFLRQKKEHELEHVAFLSMWLSRFVFPFKDPEAAINSEVFPMAVHLSKGRRLALAPAVLAGVYHFLGLLKQELFRPLVNAPRLGEVDHETVPGPAEIVQHWAYERFMIISPPTREIPLGEPRPARWCGRKLETNRKVIRKGLKLNPQVIQWRPYLLPIEDWDTHYGMEEREVVNGDGSDKELSFGMCLCACELKGIVGVPNQKYMPHRVSRQFGMDQHYPED